MTESLRHLVIQQAARLQDAPAFEAPDWPTLGYLPFRHRVEGLALGLLAHHPPQGAVGPGNGVAWDWVSEVAAACCGLRWDPQAPPLPKDLLGGPGFNDEVGRPIYHDLEERVGADTPFWGPWTHGTWLTLLHRLNRRLGWDHTTVLSLPPEALEHPEGRLAAWSALYAGAFLRLTPADPPRGWRRFFSPRTPPWDPSPFRFETLP